MSRLIEYDMRKEIYEHYQKLDLAFYKMNKTGVAGIFAAILELTKEKVITVSQKKNFDKLLVKKL